MHSRIALPLQPNVVPRQREDTSTKGPLPATRWFYVVDVEATSSEETHVLRNEGVVLALSSTEADASTAAALEGIGVVYYAELSETERQRMTERIADSQREEAK